ncbi:DUF805 domain-containing protein [Novosphingobium sp. Gsoil 351]|uniref:DUF805 domain-containing protein n=1 Tax=Novosphingobium sp. Gsoil 351 TaxID=2675225 RepID=UPI0012B49717|nr:DUF805 domain-containing protein [Novosphingobium sp. Gsoil 351]QGN55441.1 DUF805 domain-containing protein [Novosphingobium sp. Gsoil 351]
MEWMLMPLRRYAEFTGRSRRMEFWMFALLMVIVELVCFALMLGGGFSLASIEDPTATPAMPGPVFWLGAGMLGIFALAIIVPAIAVTVRRLHDRDMSGWWYLGFVVLSMVPVVGFIASIAFLVIMCLPGTPGPNRFGPDPLDPTSAEVFA